MSKRGTSLSKAHHYMALVQDPDFNIMQQSHGLFAIAKLLVLQPYGRETLHGTINKHLTQRGTWKYLDFD